MTDQTLASRAWALFDEIVARAAFPAHTNPWYRTHDGSLGYEPDYRTLRKLLAVPLSLGASPQSGVPALALDVWTSYELRRCGFDPDAVWPRPSSPRILPSTVAALRAGATARQRAVLDQMLASGKTFDGETGATANLLGRNYVKQVDVVMSSWATGPELMISTKRMDSSFGKNAANRVEESYGDAKNLRGRHPRSALGFVYGLRSAAFTQALRTADWIVDLLGKLGQEDDAYDAVALVVPEWATDSESGEEVEDDGDDVAEDDPLVAAGLAVDLLAGAAQIPAAMPLTELDEALEKLPDVSLRSDLVPPELSPERFFSLIATRVLDSCPVTFHRQARQRRREPTAAQADDNPSRAHP